MSYREFQDRYKKACQLVKDNMQKGLQVSDIYFGEKYIDKLPSGEDSIRFHVSKKLSKSQLKKSELLPSKIGKYKTDVIEANPEHHTRIESPQSSVQPLMGGVEIQSRLYMGQYNWGTLGGIVTIKGINYGITNYHVLFGDNNVVNEPIEVFQPHRPGSRKIGISTPVYDKDLDYVLIRLQQPYDTDQSINAIKGEIVGFKNYESNLRVIKMGAYTKRTTGITNGRSCLDCAKITIRYDSSGINDSPLISHRGDSGSFWVLPSAENMGNLKVLALHTSGEPGLNIAYANLFSSIHSSINNKI